MKKILKTLLALLFLSSAACSSKTETRTYCDVAPKVCELEAKERTAQQNHKRNRRHLGGAKSE